MADGVRALRLGVVGLGRAFALMLPTFVADPRVRLVAAADPRPEARQRFTADFGAPAFDDVAALCRHPDVDAVYIASPHEHHARHVELAAAAGRHALVEKPLAVTLDEADRMVAAVERAGTVLVVGHSHSFDLPILHTRRLIASGRFGAVRMIAAQAYTDFMYRLRRPEELDTAQGGGVLFSQAAHQVDIVRMLAGGMAERVRAHTGAWDAARPSEGAYAALLSFAGGAFATLSYSGYGRFDTDELCGDIGEMGEPRDPARYGHARRALAGIEDANAEAAAKRARSYGGPAFAAPAAGERWHGHFGMVVASCDGADLRPLPHGVMVYGDGQVWLEALPRPAVPRAEVIDELHAAVFAGRLPSHDARWGRATLEVCVAMLASARGAGEVALVRQQPWREPA
jgi:phthalate 4,5-cis-dihydrodiol dehydrogenase